MTLKEKGKEQAVETCSTGSCSTEKSKEQAQKQVDEKEEKRLEQHAKKVGGSCCG